MNVVVTYKLNEAQLRHSIKTTVTFTLVDIMYSFILKI